MLVLIYKNNLDHLLIYIFLISAIRLQIYTFCKRNGRFCPFFLFYILLKEENDAKIKLVSKKSIPFFTFPVLDGHIIVPFKYYFFFSSQASIKPTTPE